jgi:HAE1 family hydrophobic/amphiphilic exporter-1
MTGDRRRAAKEGTAAVAVAVLASAGTNVVVLLPIGMMGGIIGIFFRPFAMTMLVVNVVSLFISFTLTPILCAVLLKEVKEESVLRRIEYRFNDLFDKVNRTFVRLLRLLTARRWSGILVLAVTGAALIHSFALAGRVGFNFIPPVDRGEIFIKLEFPTHQNLDETVARVREAESILKTLPDLRHMYSTAGKVESVGGQVSEGVYLAQIILKLPDKTERERTAQDYLESTRRLLSNVPGAVITASIPSLLGGQQIPVEMEIAGDDLAELEKVAEKVLAEAKGMEGMIEPTSTVQEGKPEIRVIPKRATLADMGAASSNLGLMLRANLEGIQAAVFRTGDRTLDIRVKLSEKEGKNQIPEFQIPTGSERPVILSGFTRLEERRAPVQISRSDKRRVVKLFSNLSPNLPLGTAVQKMEEAIRSKNLLPPGYEFVFRGDYERMEESSAEFIEAGLLAVLLTYLALAAILESFTQPFLIMTTIPLALIGVFWALFLTGASITIYVLLGVVMLIGIVVNNAVLILDQVATFRKQGRGEAEAMIGAVAAQFRPVIMITLAAIVGMFPLATASGLGSELTVGIGVASVGGIFLSALLALVVIPVMYLLAPRKESEPIQAAELAEGAAGAYKR